MGDSAAAGNGSALEAMEEI